MSCPVLPGIVSVSQQITVSARTTLVKRAVLASKRDAVEIGEMRIGGNQFCFVAAGRCINHGIDHRELMIQADGGCLHGDPVV
jgi:hypothetical protein